MWESNKEVKFNMSDALISAQSFSILAGTAVTTKQVKVHVKDVLTLNSSLQVTLTQTPVISTTNPMFVFITESGDTSAIGTTVPNNATNGYQLAAQTMTFAGTVGSHLMVVGDIVIVDYYYNSATTAKEFIIDSGKFSGYFRIEADCLWRRESDGVDLPAKFIMPRSKMASNFTITMASEGKGCPLVA